MRQFIILSFIGLIAGFVFGGLLKIIEQLTDEKVYTLLLNVDYFPVLKDMPRTELIDFSFHLIVSMILVIVLYSSLKYFGRENKVADYVLLNIVIALMLYITTTFSERTPELTDFQAFTYWLFGHVVFGLLVGWMVQYMKKKR